jgi:Putative zinc-finger
MTSSIHCGQFEALLPWYVNDTATPTDRARVEEHLHTCGGCRERLLREQALLQHLRRSESLPAPDADESWLRFEKSLGDGRGAYEPVSTPSRLLRWVVVGQAAALAVLAVLLTQLLWDRNRSAPDFHTVTTAHPGPAPSGFALRVAAAPDATPATIAQIARDEGARVVAGPSEQGVYTLELDQQSLQQQALARLRAMPQLRLVEPIGGR